MFLTAKNLTHDDFRSFGNVIEREGEPASVNSGLSKKWSLSVSQSQVPDPVDFVILETRYSALVVEELGRHVYSNQCFVPHAETPFVVVVAEAELGRPSDADFFAFVSNGLQGISFDPGTWHSVILPVTAGVISFTSWMKKSPEPDVEFVKLKPAVHVHVVKSDGEGNEDADKG